MTVARRDPLRRTNGIYLIGFETITFGPGCAWCFKFKAHEQELRSSGVVSVSLFGSVARGENLANDVDVVVRLGKAFSAPRLDCFSRMDDLEERLTAIPEYPVDVVEEPVRREHFQQQIDRDRAIAF